MKIHIIYPYFDKQQGGGSSFLRALRAQWVQEEYYAHNLKDANCILFNSHHGIEQVLYAKWKYPKKVFVQRIDGPMALYNAGDERDNLAYVANQLLADGTIFQSAWSMKENHARGLPRKKFETVIFNAADPLFTPRPKKALKSNKIKLIAVSWSPHKNKGFDTLQWLDEHLDTNKFEMTFVGNSPVPFQNIKHLPAMSPDKLLKELHQADIFIFPSKIEACSNTLLEALACRLPVIAFDGGSNKELVGQGGLLFLKNTELPGLLSEITNNYDFYQHNIKISSLLDIAKHYHLFMEMVANAIVAPSPVTAFSAMPIFKQLIKQALR